MASSLPIFRFTESVIAKVSTIGNGTPASWWLAILTIGPLLGSFITGPAAMTISPSTRHRFYSLKPSETLKYATLGLLFVNISVGGVFTQFASPPVVIVARVWNWDMVYMLTHFGWKAGPSKLSCPICSISQYFGEIYQLAPTFQTKSKIKKGRRPIPWRITATHILFLAGTAANAHYPVLVILGLLFFLAYVSATRLNQHAIALRRPLLVGFFLESPNHSRRVPAMVDSACLGSLSKWPL